MSIVVESRTYYQRVRLNRLFQDCGERESDLELPENEGVKSFDKSEYLVNHTHINMIKQCNIIDNNAHNKVNLTVSPFFWWIEVQPSCWSTWSTQTLGSFTHPCHVFNTCRYLLLKWEVKEESCDQLPHNNNALYIIIVGHRRGQATYDETNTLKVTVIKQSTLNNILEDVLTDYHKYFALMCENYLCGSHKRTHSLMWLLWWWMIDTMAQQHDVPHWQTMCSLTFT